jgi:hypothetical protein
LTDENVSDDSKLVIENASIPLSPIFNKGDGRCGFLLCWKIEVAEFIGVGAASSAG